MGRRGRRPAAHHGVLAVDKPSGVTSHDVVAAVRRAFGQRQVGHTGTLDPMATGLLVLTLGQATRLGRFLEATEKTYEGAVTFGRATDTWDAEGRVVEEAPVPPLDRDRVDAALPGLVGEVEQEVPAFSAVKVDGERLYAKARRDEAVELPVRRVTIHALEPLALDGDRLAFRARVSKGTYIRTLAVQIGRALGLPAHLSMLRRTAVGPFTIDGAAGIDGLGPEHLIPPAEALSFLPALRTRPEAVEAVGFGRALTAAQARPEGPVRAGGVVRVLAPDGTLLAVAEALADAAEWDDRPTREPALRYACVLIGR